MKKSSDVSLVPPKGESRLSFLFMARFVELISRLVLCVAAVAAVIFCVALIQANRSQSRARTVEANEVGSPEPGDSLASILNGDWEFSAIPWSVKIQDLTKEDGAEQMRAVPSSLAFEVGEQERDLVSEAIELLSPQKSEIEGGTAYKVEGSGFQLVGYANSNKPPQIVLVKTIQPLDENRVSYIELARRPAPNAGLVESSSSFPKCPESSKFAVRHDSSGAICAELIELNSNFDALLSEWISDGWTVVEQKIDGERLASQGKTENLSDTLRAEEVFLCSKDTVSVFAILTNGLRPGTQGLFLVRSNHQ